MHHDDERTLDSKLDQSTSVDPFDLSRLTLPQNFGDMVGAKKCLTAVSVRKPNRQEFIRVRPGGNWRIDTGVLEVKEERETYLVDPSLWPILPGEITPKVLVTAVNRQNIVFLWPLRLPGSDGRVDQWSQSALEASMLATDGWICVKANMSAGAYEVYQAGGDLPDPVWPEISFQELIRIAFKDRFIKDVAHPVIRRLRGER